MADSYRGLYIKIGADDVEFQKTIASMVKAANRAQADIVRINKALKFDPASAEMMATKVQLLGEKIQATAAKFASLRAAEETLKTDIAKNQTKSFDNLSMSVATTTENLERTNASIEQVRGSLQQIAKDNNLEKLAREKDINKLVAGLRTVSSEAEKLGAKYERLSVLQKQYTEEFNEVRKVDQLRSVRIEMELLAAETRETMREFVQLKATTAIIEDQSDAFKKARKELDLMTRAASSLEEQMRVIDSALQFDPTSVDAMIRKQRQLREEFSLSTGRAKELKVQIEELRKTTGVKSKNELSESMRLEFERTKEEAARTEQVVKQLEGELEGLRVQEKELARQEIMHAGSEEDLRKIANATVDVKNRIQQLIEKLEEERKTAKAAMEAFEPYEAIASLERLENELTQTEAKARAAGRALESFSQSTTMSYHTLRSIGSALYSTITPAVIMAGYRMISYAEETDAAFRNLVKTVNTNSTDMLESLRSAALEYSKTHATSAATMLEMESLGAQMGLTIDQLDSFGRVASNLDISTDMDADNIALSLGQLNNIMHLSGENFEQLGDALVRLGNNMPAQESTIMNVTQRIAGMGTIVGFSADELLAWATAIAATGQKAESSGTAISKTMSMIESAVQAGDEQLDLFAKTAHMTSEEFAEAWNTSPSEALQRFILGLKNLDETGGSVDQRLIQLGITGVRQKQALLGLTQTVGVLNDALVMSKDAWDGVDDEWGNAGDAANEAARKSEGFSGAVQILSNNAGVLSDTLASTLTPVVRALGEALGGMASVLKNMPEPLKQATIRFTAMIAAAGPSLTLFSSIKKGLSELPDKYDKWIAKQKLAAEAAKEEAAAVTVDTVAKKTNAEFTGIVAAKSKLFETSLKAATVAQKALNIAMTAMTGIGIITFVASAIGAIIGLAGSLYEAAYASDEFRKKVGKSNDEAKASAQDYEETNAQMEKSSARVKQQAEDMAGLAEEWNELSNKTDKTADDYDRLLVIEGKLKKSSTTIADFFNDGRYAAEGAGKELIKLAEAEGQVLIQENKRSQYAKKIEQQTSAIENEKSALEDLEKAQKIVDQYKELDASGEWVNPIEFSASLDALEKAKQDHEIYAKQVAETTEEVEKLEDEVGKEDALLSKLQLAYKKTAIGAMSVQGASEKYGVTVEELTGYIQTQKEAMLELDEQAISETASTIETLAENSEIMRKVLANAGYDSQQLASQLEVLGMSAAEFNEYLLSVKDSILDVFNAKELGEQLNTDQMYSNLANNFDLLARQSRDITTLFRETGYAFNADFIEKIQEAPGQMIGVMEELTEAWNSGNEDAIAESQAFIDSFKEFGEAGMLEAAEAARATSDAMKQATGDVMEEGAKGIEENSDDMTNAAGEIADSVVEKFDLYDELFEQAVNGANGYIQGWMSKLPEAMGTLEYFTNSVLGVIPRTQQSNSPSKKTRSYGQDFGEGYGLGISDEYKYIVSKAEQASNIALQALNYDPSQFAQTVGNIAYNANTGHYAALAGAYTNAVAPINSGDTYNVYINDNKINDNEAIKDGVIGILYEAKRVGDM